MTATTSRTSSTSPWPGRSGAGPGTKGLSCFIIPKYLPNADGSPGEWNGVSVTKIEDKMGIKGSVTCELTFGLDKPCIGYLLGGVHEGIRQMFHVLEDARMSIGAKSAATMSTGYLNALEYAKERLQGPDLTQTRDPNAPRVAIIKHPDVRRMLIQQKAYAEGMRALTLYSAWVLDQVMLHPEEPYWSKLTDLLLPLVKGYCSEKSYDLMGQCLQVFGGSGFTKDYPLEQYVRDLKIDSLYEGTTGIQAMDLFFRKIGRDQGATLMRLASGIMETAKPVGDGDAFAKERGLAGQGPRGRAGPTDGHARLRHGGHAGPRPALQGRAALQRPAREPGRGGHGLAAAAPRRDRPRRPPGGGGQGPRPSTRARSPRPAGSPPTCCPGPRCGAPWPRRSRAR